jgi:hypothetical protein
VETGHHERSSFFYSTHFIFNAAVGASRHHAQARHWHETCFVNMEQNTGISGSRQRGFGAAQGVARRIAGQAVRQWLAAGGRKRHRIAAGTDLSSMHSR